MQFADIDKKSMYSETESFELSVEELCDLPPMTREEEDDCARRWHESGDQEAIDALVLRNIRFALTLCREYSNETSAAEDLLGEAILGMYRAAKKFQPGRVPFIGYAQWWIRTYLQKYSIITSRAIKMPAQSKYGFSYVRKYRSIVGSNNYASPAEIRRVLGIGDKYGLSDSALESAQIGMSPVVSLNAPIGDEDNAADYIDMLADTAPTPEEIAEGASRTDKILYAMTCLNEREHDIVTRLYLDDSYFTPETMNSGNVGGSRYYMPLSEVGKRWGITRERVRQICNEALAKMKKQHGDLLETML